MEPVGQGDRERWNARWRERANVALLPSPWLTSLDEMLPRVGRALDVAGGAGRHALWLARRGLDVTLVDVSDEGLALAAVTASAERLAVRLVELDLESEPLPTGPWDVIVCVHYLQRSLFPAFAASLTPGGLLVFSQATEKNLERNPQPPRAYLLVDGEAPQLVAGLDIIAYEEGWQEEGRHEARLVARRPPARP